MYSAGTGQSALDRLSDNDPSSTSVYTRVLLKHFGEKGLALRDLAADVRKEVDQLSKSVGHEQSPAYYDEMTIDFTFLPGDASDSIRGGACTVRFSGRKFRRIGNDSIR